LFFTSDTQRVALARQRYFEEGQLPSGSVSAAVLESWARCHRQRLNPCDALEFNQVSPSRAQLALQRNRELIDAWSGEIHEIEHTLAGTMCSAILTDASGVLIAATGSDGPQAAITPAAHRIGVNLSEECVGTTAPSLVVKTGKPATVWGGEHYFEGVMPMHCAAAPIRGISGQLAGVLDISREGSAFEFDAAAVVSLYASSIENRLLTSQAREHLVIKLQVNPALIDTPMVGLAGIDTHGRLAWTNSVAERLFGLTFRHPVDPPTEVYDLFGLTLNRLLALPSDRATPLRLANGLSIWVRAMLQAPNGGLSRGAVMVLPERSVSEEPPKADEHASSAVPQEPSAPTDAPLSSASTTLRASDNDLILRTVRALNGNISKAAAQLGVSRGLIYRRLREARDDAL
jgi:sigma-54 dependent transcriptional regulator, acetoin dehydrogenase operon transcriptional activator AcoR